MQRLVVALRGTESRARADRRPADLVSTVAHELRSPLTSVKGFTATLLAKWDRFTDAQKRAMLATVNADADRVTRLLSELLDVSRIDAGRLELRPQVVDVPEAVRRVVSGRGGGRRHARTASGSSPPTTLPEMWLDPDKLDQVLHNLVENGIRHGAGTVTIETVPAKTATGGPAGCVIVSDEGDGIGRDQPAARSSPGSGAAARDAAAPGSDCSS